MTLTVRDKGIDYSGARPAPADIVHNGGRFVLRYSAGAASAAAHSDHHDVVWKLITPAEFHALVDAGLDVIANSEWSKARITEGHAAGHADGAADLALWRSCGLAKGASIYVSWDDAPNHELFDKVANYLAAYGEALDGVYHVDLYAGDPALVEMKRRGLIRFGWRPNADSWSGNGHFYQTNKVAEVTQVSGAHIWQNGNYWYGNKADEDIILRTPVGSHRESAAHPIPTPPDDPSITHLPAGVPAWPFPNTTDYFGLITGPLQSHGGDPQFDSAAIIADVVRIQKTLVRHGYAGHVAPGWADGRYEQPTAAAVRRFQRAHELPQNGEIRIRDWRVLFSP